MGILSAYKILISKDEGKRALDSTIWIYQDTKRC